MAKPVPEGLHTLTPSLVVKDASQAIAFYQKAFGAEELSRFTGPDGKSVMHSSLRIGNSIFFVVDEMPGAGAKAPSSGGTPISLQINVENADALFQRAVAAGAKVAMPLEDQFWGDRWGTLTDPSGHSWAISTHKEDLSPEEMKKRSDAFFASMAAKSR